MDHYTLVILMREKSVQNEEMIKLKNKLIKYLVVMDQLCV